MLVARVLLLGLAILATLYPRALAVPVTLIGGWVAVTLLLRALRLRRSRPVRERKGREAGAASRADASAAQEPTCGPARV